MQGRIFVKVYIMQKAVISIGRYLKKTDTPLILLVIAASVYGVVLINTCAPASVPTQILAIVIGLFAYVILSLLDIDILADNWAILFITGIALILLLLTPLGYGEGGNHAWLRFLGIGLQPSEVVKLFFIIIIARFISKYTEERKLDHIVSLLIMGAIFAVYFALIYVVSADLGSALIFLFIFVVMLFAGGLKIYWFLIALTGIVVASPYIWGMMNETRRNRIIALFDPASVDATGLGITWQTNQSKAAIAGGGVFGMGLGNGTLTQSGSVPKQRTDFIFSAAGEELGMVGCLFVIALLIAIIVRILIIGMRCQSRMGALVCVGIAAMLLIQTAENIGMCLGVAPVIGITLPFFSSGGSSIVASFAAIGIVSGIKAKPKPVMFQKY